ncbi:MAG: hypothetical protein N3H31_05575, partial [Candidatus Nezhaarchaeota archaeon]|nr:hypothetical protein [Candidatus Nezhaarchaeota archaeon]
SEMCIRDSFYTVRLVEEARRAAAEAIPEECLGCKYASTCAGGSVQARLRVWGTLKRRDPACTL